MNYSKQDLADQKDVRKFYNSIYYKDASAIPGKSRHFSRLASKLGIQPRHDVLDVACGKGEWLLAVKECGGKPAGIDISEKAIAICKSIIPDGEIHTGSAEVLPFDDKKFHIVTCLGALEHFIDPQKALEEMNRTARDDAVFLLLVPNRDFLTRKLGLFSGTDQNSVREKVRTLAEWRDLFEAAGLEVTRRWKDLHVLAWSWISAKKWYHIPLRAAQALALVVWPLSWQYQVYHLCKKRKIEANV
ncbi:MAG: methyltransferase domain-containing protein [Deltaproteobacteria bacterium]|nr:methyltransferase domain-containing protein [Deltaproteobacteria bacterium]